MKADKNNVVKRTIKFLVIIFSSILLILFMNGTANASKIDHSTFAMAIGIDKSQNDENKILVSFQIVPPQVTSQNGGDIEKVIVTSLETESLEKAISLIHNYMSTFVNFSHTRAIIFSEEVAKEGIFKYVNSISSNNIFDTNMYVMVSRGSAKEYLENISKDTEINPTLYYNIVNNAYEASSTTYPITIMEFLRLYHEDGLNPIAPVCSIIENTNSNILDQSTKQENKDNNEDKQNDNEESNKSQNQDSKNQDSKSEDSKNKESTSSSESESKIKIEIGGIAVFEQDKLKGDIEKEMIPYYLMIDKKIENCFTTVTHKDYKTDEMVDTNLYFVQRDSAKIKVNINGRNPIIDITVTLYAYVTDTKNHTFNMYDTEYMNYLKSNISSSLEKNMNEYLSKTQNEFNLSINDFIHYIKLKFMTENELKNYNFDEKYKDIKFNVKFNIKFGSSNLNVKK